MKTAETCGLDAWLPLQICLSDQAAHYVPLLIALLARTGYSVATRQPIGQQIACIVMD